MAWLPHGEKNFEDIFIRFGATHERDRQTDGHRMPAIAALIHSIARQKAATDLLRSAPMTSSKKLLIIKRTEERQKFRPCLPRGKFVAVARCTRCP